MTDRISAMCDDSRALVTVGRVDASSRAKDKSLPASFIFIYLFIIWWYTYQSYLFTVLGLESWYLSLNESVSIINRVIRNLSNKKREQSDHLTSIAIRMFSCWKVERKSIAANKDLVQYALIRGYSVPVVGRICHTTDFLVIWLCRCAISQRKMMRSIEIPWTICKNVFNNRIILIYETEHSACMINIIPLEK